MRLENGKKAAKRIFACYPDYAKAPAEYLATVTELLAGYPDWLLLRLADTRNGIASRSSWLPTVADITKLADQWLDEEAKRRALPKERRAVLVEPRKRAEPFPKLWEALGHEKLAGRNFEELSEAAKRLAVNGRHEAELYLDERDKARAPRVGVVGRSEPTSEDFDALSASLKTPAAPMSKELRAKLEREGVLQPKPKNEPEAQPPGEAPQ